MHVQKTNEIDFTEILQTWMYVCAALFSSLNLPNYFADILNFTYM